MNITIPQGQLTFKKIPAFNARRWRLINRLRFGFWLGFIQVSLAKLLTHLLGIATLTSELRGQLIRNGKVYDLGVMGYRVVTTVGVGFIVDAWQNSVELEIMKYHGVGTGTTAEAAGDTALVTESTTAINPDSTRATGSLAEGASANIFSTVGTVVFDNTAAITEHGIFSQAATGGGVLFDRTVFAALNVVSGDSIAFTYQVTLSAGG